MKHEKYAPYESNHDFSVIDFISIGKHGSISKRITFTTTELENVYNLAFGDVDENGDIDDCRVSNNGDRNKILATVFKVVEDYTIRYPERWIYFKGSTKERTRLYRIAVGLNLEELSRIFEIYAFTDEQEELKLFTKNMEISSFVIKRKNH